MTQLDRQGAKLISKQRVTAFLKKEYGLRVETAKLLEGGCTNAAWEILTDKGDFIAKIFSPEEGDKDWIENEADVYGFLNDNGIRTPRVVKTNNGKRLGEMESGSKKYPVMLMGLEKLRRAWVDSISKKELEVIGQKTARMHQLFVNYPKYEVIKNHSYPGTGEEEVKYPMYLIGKWRDFSPTQITIMQLAEKGMFEYLRTHPLPPTLPQTIIHADLALEHAQLLPNGDIYFFDFSDRKVGARIEDVATFLTMLYCAEDVTTDQWKEVSGWFLEGYQRVSKLTPEESEATNNLMITRILGMAQFLAVLADGKPGIHVVNTIKKGYELGEYLLSQTEATKFTAPSP